MSVNETETLHAIALTNTRGIGAAQARTLFAHYGSATEVYAHREELHRISPKMAAISLALGERQPMEIAKRELEFAEKHGIRCLNYGDTDYPSRLRECDDAPLVLFHQGNSDLNAKRIISVVGTRHATEYGREVCSQLMKELHAMCPSLLVVSGLAYGIDIAAHRAALDEGLSTVAVLAHGLDRIYPSAHRQTAIEMIRQGGLLTEYPTGTNPDRPRFVMRNRIVAGMSDATIVVESAAKGGALITAEMAVGYGRDCFAVPGRVLSPYSEGCNHLIRDNKAGLITSALDLMKGMNWEEGMNTLPPVQRELFPNLTPEEEMVVELLKDEENGVNINLLTVKTSLGIGKLSALLFDLEMKGVTTQLPGNRHKLLGI